MCRILAVRAAEPFALSEHLVPFAQLAEQSREFQGHGWGCAWLTEGSDGAGGWQHYHDIRPIWADPERPEARTRLLVAHARSAFRDEGIAVENNMPFAEGERVFVFNGELHGVRVKAPGCIGAEKIFNYVLRFDRGNLGEAVRRGVEIIEKRSRYVRAMNFIIATPGELHVCCHYGENPGYFQLQQRRTSAQLVICSERYGAPDGWKAMHNRSVQML